MYTVYALYNQQSGKIYIGQTRNLDKRLSDHNKKRGNHYTARIAGEWEVIYQEKVENRTEALKREKQLKSFQGRQFIKQYIPR